MSGLIERRSIDTITAEIQFYKQQAGISILEIGKRLIEAKEQLNHGEWLDWLGNRVDISERMAQNFMKISREYSNPKSVSDLGVTKALALLAVPAEEREQFAEAVHAEDLSVRELKAKIREAENQAEGWKRKAELAKAAESEKDEALKVAEQHADLQNDLIASLREENRILEGNVKELKERPVEVATVDATGEQLREAERKGREAAGKQYQAAAESLKQQNQELTQALEAARLETDQYQGANEELRAQLEAARKSKAPEEPLLRCKWLFADLQDTLNELTGLLPQVDEVNRAKLRKVLPGALRSMAERMEG